MHSDGPFSCPYELLYKACCALLHVAHQVALVDARIALHLAYQRPVGFAAVHLGPCAAVYRERRDADILQEISATYAAVSFTVTCADDALSVRTEPGAPASSERFRAMAALAAKGIYTGVTMMPLLPLINDTRENVEAIVRRAKDAGASYILPMFGVTLRSGSREHFHATLDREFPGLKARYEACFGNRYECFSPSYRKLDDTFRNLCAKLGLETRMRFYAPTLPEQGSLF